MQFSRQISNLTLYYLQSTNLNTIKTRNIWCVCSTSPKKVRKTVL